LTSTSGQSTAKAAVNADQLALFFRKLEQGLARFASALPVASAVQLTW